MELGNSCQIKTGKLDANVSVSNGKYPFFTCGHIPLKIDKYAFDCSAIIISGNGEIEVKYYEGKFNAYQRTYVLEPEKFFYLFLKQCEKSINSLRDNSQGSVIKFITKGMLEKITIIKNEKANEYNNKIKLIYNFISKLNIEVEKLTNIKSNLLLKYF